MIHIGNSEHGRRIAHAAGVGYDPEMDQVLSRVTPEGNLRGGVIFTNYSKVSIQMHMAGFEKNWATPEFLVANFNYPFNQLEVRQVLAAVPSTNVLAMEIDIKLGFELLTLIPGAVPDGDMVILSMSREQCKWLKLVPRYPRVRQEQAA